MAQTKGGKKKENIIPTEYEDQVRIFLKQFAVEPEQVHVLSNQVRRSQGTISGWISIPVGTVFIAKNTVYSFKAHFHVFVMFLLIKFPF